jgi:hypothetical protein
VSVEEPGWRDRLAKRWGVSPQRVFIILLVFTCTGFTVLFLKRPLTAWVAGDGPKPLWFSILYYVLILPFYNVLLLAYGALFGQFRFFWEFEKRFFRRLGGKG